MDAKVNPLSRKNISPKRVFARYIPLTLAFVWSVATIQFVFVFEQVAWQQYIIPTLGGILVGSILARLKLLSLRMEAQRALFQGIADAASICSWLHDSAGRLSYVSAASQTVLGVQAEALEAQPERLSAMLAEENSHDYTQRVQALLRRFGSDEFSLNLQTPTGVEKRVHVHLESLLDGDGRIVGVLGQAETARVASVEPAALQRSLRQDEITGLGNRSQLLEELNILCENPHRQHSLFVIHLEGLARIRDLYGEAFADKFLRTWVDMVKKEQGSLFQMYRLGNNRMALLLADCNTEQAQGWIEPLCTDMTAPVTVDEASLSVQVNVGMAVFPDDAATATDWLDNAELAARAAKEHHAPWGLYTPVLRKVHEGDERKEKRLIQAVEKGDVHAWVQPIYRLPALTQTGVELQGYWRPDGAHWRPLSLDWSLLERCGLARKAERLLLQQVLSSLKQMEENGVLLRCGFNLPAAALLDQGLEAFLQAQMQQTGLSPDRLVLEVADAELHTLGVREENAIRQLAEDGFTLALDHFGAGLASLSRLKSLPFKVVKLDHALLRNLSAEEREIWDRVVALGKEQGLDMLLSGVENQVAFEQAQAFGVDFVQGAFLHELMPLDDLRVRVASKGPEALTPQ